MKAEQFKSSITEQIRYTETKIESDKENLSKDYVYYLSWNAKDIYCNEIRVREWKRWLTSLESIEDPDYFFHTELKKYDSFLDHTWNVAIECTNGVSEMCTTWKYQVIMELRNSLRRWKEGKV